MVYFVCTLYKQITGTFSPSLSPCHLWSQERWQTTQRYPNHCKTEQEREGCTEEKGQAEQIGHPPFWSRQEQW
ncbi:hypothetical protein Klosneuvirus_1_136 [Klosneuvirus KNV1]|uniref:Uncharacterized protein n=1 Tax=Klosneuvirus KNV1 TaxID=1977640 RepID=A0A1V0SHS4_9VIRU|nr:hypothetical protein Klosneuvirus_1_136 [Klosneuvirus KNV1]